MSPIISIAVSRLYPDVPLPEYETALAAGFDLRAILRPDNPEPGYEWQMDATGKCFYVLQPMNRILIPTGLRMAIPEGYCLQIDPRSGLAWKKGITVLNAPGIIDADYRGEIKVVLINTSDEPFVISDHDRIAQGVITVAPRAVWVVTNNLDETARGTNGFGSTGVAS